MLKDHIESARLGGYGSSGADVEVFVDGVNVISANQIAKDFISGGEI